MKTGTKLLILSLLFPLVMHNSYGAEDIPRVVITTEVDGKDIKPLVLTNEQISLFIKTLEKKDRKAILVEGKTLFRPYAALSEGYNEIMKKFISNSRPTFVQYSFPVGDAEKLRITVDNMAHKITHVTQAIESRDVEEIINGKPFEDKEALQVMYNYLELNKKKYIDPKLVTIKTGMFGKRARIFYATIKDESPSAEYMFIMDNDTGFIGEGNLSGLVRLCNVTYPPSTNPADHKKIIYTIISLTPISPKIISSIRDIPEYEKSKIDPDLESAVRQLYSWEDKVGRLVYVVYTYQEIGGIVSRYRFRFDKDGKFSEWTSVELCHGIGDAKYLQ
jgi:hypothetical protein